MRVGSQAPRLRRLQGRASCCGHAGGLRLHGPRRWTISAPMDALIDSGAGELWVFGYGSLMWRPGFDFTERVDAKLIGAHRALCVYPFVHRGTPERPGLVLGLDRGGACRGLAFRVQASKRAETVAYLRAREQVTMVYREFVRPVRLKTSPERVVPALVYM